MEVRKGYKQTEVGVIPKDWNLKLWGDVITSCSSGATPYRGKPDYYKGDIKWITSGELNYNIIYDTIEHISKEALQKTNLKIHPEGTFLMAITGLEAAGTRGSCGIVGSPATTNQSCMAIYPSTDLLLTKYLYHYYVYHGDELAFEYCQGTKQQSYTARLIRILPIILPPTLAEQEAIAEALSDADAFIEAVEQLLAKKRQVKQGAMSELLTGKRRLSGFSGKWEVKKLGELGIFRGGSGFPIMYQGKTEGDYPFYKVSDMNNEGNSTFMIDANNWISEGIKKEIGANSFPKHTIIFAKVGAAIFLERKKILTQESCVDNNVMGFILEKDITDYRYIHYLFLNIQLGKLVSATALPSLNGKQIAELAFGIPSLPEQTAIAEILSDMDAEISALEGKLVKARQVKAGMMSELLTGKIRLNRD